MSISKKGPKKGNDAVASRLADFTGEKEVPIAGHNKISGADKVCIMPRIKHRHRYFLSVKKATGHWKGGDSCGIEGELPMRPIQYQGCCLWQKKHLCIFIFLGNGS